MNIAEDDDQIAKTKAEQLIADIALIPGVRGIRVEPYTDYTGDPSLQLTFAISKNIRVDDKEFMAQFLDFSVDVHTRLLHSDLNRFPYSGLERVD